MNTNTNQNIINANFIVADIKNEKTNTLNKTKSIFKFDSLVLALMGFNRMIGTDENVNYF